MIVGKYLLGFAFLFFVLQIIFIKFVKNKFQYTPIAIVFLVAIYALYAYISPFAYSESVREENQYFIKFLTVPISGAFLGCLSGWFLSKKLKKL